MANLRKYFCFGVTGIEYADSKYLTKSPGFLGIVNSSRLSTPGLYCPQRGASKILYSMQGVAARNLYEEEKEEWSAPPAMNMKNLHAVIGTYSPVSSVNSGKRRNVLFLYSNIHAPAWPCRK